jgi:hypothetical protein
MFHDEHCSTKTKHFQVVTVCVKSGQGLRSRRWGAIFGEWVLTSLGYRINTRRDSTPHPRPKAHGPRGAARHAVAPCAAHGTRPTARRERVSTRAVSAGPRSNATRPTARERGTGSAERGTRPTGRRERFAPVRFRDNGPRPTGPGLTGASGARKIGTDPIYFGKKNVQRAPGPVYTGEKKARRSGPARPSRAPLRESLGGHKVQ